MSKYTSVDWIAVVDTDELKKANISKEEFAGKHECVVFFTEGEPYMEVYSKDCISQSFVDSFSNSISNFYDVQLVDERIMGIYVSLPYMEVSSFQDVAISIACDLVEFNKGF